MPEVWTSSQTHRSSLAVTKSLGLLPGPLQPQPTQAELRPSRAWEEGGADSSFGKRTQVEISMTVLFRQRGCREVTKGHPSSFFQIFITYCPTLKLGHKAQSCPFCVPLPALFTASSLVYGRLLPLPQGHAHSPCRLESPPPPTNFGARQGPFSPAGGLPC